MGNWLTSKSRLEQGERKQWFLCDNELYKDDDGEIYLVPRNYETDNYTIPNWIAWVAGSKSEEDVRPSHIHDFGCQYHQLIRLKIGEKLLKDMRYLRIYNDKFICEDIPTRFLELVPVTKWEIDCLFKRAMKSAGVSNPVSSVYRGGVFFNFGWLGNHPPFDMRYIYCRKRN